MRTSRIVKVLLLGLLLVRCKAEQKVTYNFPADYPEAVQKEAIELFYKGEVLYKANCASCHGIFTKGKSDVPNFTKTQLDNYSARFLKGDPLNHAVARKMSEEQLNQVVVFLAYKKQVPKKKRTR